MQLNQSIKKIKDVLVSADVITYEFSSAVGKKFALLYVDGLLDKAQLGELVVKPLAGVESKATAADIRAILASPEVKEGEDFAMAVKEISYGSAALLIDGESTFFLIGLTKPPGRAVAEPPTQIAVKGPREGFTEDIKVNCALVRKRLKSPDLRLDTIRTGRRSDTAVTICYLADVCDPKIPKKLKEQIEANEIDIVADSSYVGRFVSSRPRSLFKRCATCEKPDIFCAKLAEGRAGIIVDGSPIALTVPYMLAEDFQSSQDYFVSPYRATISRILRLAAVVISLFLPAFYVAAELFRLQLLPFGLLMTISGSVQDLPLSPSLELFFLLVVLEVLIEASVRMPKYVALVLGDTAVKAGIVSSPAIIIVALSGISAYTVPDLTGTISVIRLAYVVVAGSIGTYGILLFTALLFYYLVSSDSYGTPLLAPFSPLIKKDLRDSIYKSNIYSLDTRPAVLKSKNKTRLKVRYKEKNG